MQMDPHVCGTAKNAVVVQLRYFPVTLLVRCNSVQCIRQGLVQVEFCCVCSPRSLPLAYVDGDHLELCHLKQISPAWLHHAFLLRCLGSRKLVLGVTFPTVCSEVIPRDFLTLVGPKSLSSQPARLFDLSFELL